MGLKIQHDHGVEIDCGTGPWPYWLRSYGADGNLYMREDTFIGMYHRDEQPSGIYLRSLITRHRLKIEALHALEEYPEEDVMAQQELTPEEQQEEFNNVVRPVMEWLNKNHHPHTCVHITPTSAELLEGQMVHSTEEFLRD